MKISKKVIESAVVVFFALAVMITAVTTGNVNTEAEQYTSEDMTEAAGTEVATKEKADVEVVAAAGTEEVGTEKEVAEEAKAEKEVAEEAKAEKEVAEETKAEKETTEETEKKTKKEKKNKKKSKKKKSSEKASEWANRLMPKVEESLNIRTEANEEAEVVGKLYKGSVAEVVERGDVWTKISSGSVEGYVKNEFCVFAEEAEAMAKEQGVTYATALTGGLRVRAEANSAEETVIATVLEEGEKIKVDTAAEVPEGWVAVVCDNGTAYVSAEYVSVELELGKAISIEEELAAIKKAEEEKAAKSQRSSSGTSQKAAVAASYDDVTLLGALIQCEAGGESYEGQLAVGAVVMNRLRNGYAGSISGVIYQSGQFSPASSGALARRLANGVSSSCMQAAQAAINGADNVNGATSFRSTSSGQSGIVIGNHVFF